MLGQKKSTLDEARLIDKIVTQEKVGKSPPIDLNPIKTQLGKVDNDIQKMIREIKAANEEFQELEADYLGQEAVDEENRLKII